MNKQRGMALLMVLLMMSLMAIVAVNINDNWQRSLVRTQSQQDRLRAKWLLLGGESYARQRLQQAGEQRKAWGGIRGDLQHAHRRGGSGDTSAPR
ncbi:type II secretion system protein GspK [Serratia ureilytica]|uniref:type II secretion system protein GspK n=1 Tax=Serratia ureilytica TaxID=300181 RepID=UPI00224BA3E3|nr:type II secretion system protein GspK [Serratia ureilytica]